MNVDRREFLKAATAGAGITLSGLTGTSSGLLHSPLPTVIAKTKIRRGAADVVVVGAGAFGIWTALYLGRLGATVTVVDSYGPGNSRSTSGGETRRVRSSYSDRAHGLQWAKWAKESIARWSRWDEEWRDNLLPRLFFNTGDLIMREEMNPELERTIANWDTIGAAYEVLTQNEVAYRYPVIRMEGLNVALFEPDAGVVRARRAIEAVAEVFRKEGGEIKLARAEPGNHNGSRLESINLNGGDSLTAQTFVFACGPWLPKCFPRTYGQAATNPNGSCLLLWHAAWRRPVHLPKAPQLQFSRYYRMACLESGQPRVSR